jgi:hypothetical protein
MEGRLGGELEGRKCSYPCSICEAGCYHVTSHKTLHAAISQLPHGFGRTAGQEGHDGKSIIIVNAKQDLIYNTRTPRFMGKLQHGYDQLQTSAHLGFL